MYFGCYGNFKCPLPCNGKNKNWHLLLSHCRNFGEKKNQKCLLSGPLQFFFPQIPKFYWLSWQPTKKPKFSYHIKKKNKNKKQKKNNSSEAIRAIKLKLFKNVHSINLYKNCVFIADAYALKVSIDL